MRLAKVRLVLAVLALFLWVGYVAYQALAYGRFPVVSRSQLLASKLVVCAEVTGGADGRPEKTIKVNEVIWPPRKRDDLIGQQITITNLDEPTLKGFRGTGKYIVPLIGGEGGRYQIAPLPPSPGFDSPDLLIYPDEPLTRQQLGEALRAD